MIKKKKKKLSMLQEIHSDPVRLKGKARMWYRASTVCAEKSDVHQPSRAQSQSRHSAHHTAMQRQTESGHDISVTPLSQPTWRIAPEL